jgi:hypothetical protein
VQDFLVVPHEISSLQAHGGGGGREFLEAHNLLAAEETLQQIYETISDKPEKMVKYENAPRPDDV